MKKGLLIILALALLTAGYFLKREKKEGDVSSDTTHTVCAQRSVQATVEAPYTVKEDIILHIKGTTVTGIKQGTQSGPDMTNGYEGVLTGTKQGTRYELRFDYEIEGSQQSEEEVYELREDGFAKLRYPLIERDGVLVPDMSKSFTEQLYRYASCKGEQES